MDFGYFRAIFSLAV